MAWKNRGTREKAPNWHGRTGKTGENREKGGETRKFECLLPCLLFVARCLNLGHLQAPTLTDTELTTTPIGDFQAQKNEGKWGEMGGNGGKWRKLEIFGGEWRKMGRNGGALEKVHWNNAQTMRSNNTCVEHNHGGGTTPVKQNDTWALCASCCMLNCLSDRTRFQTEKVRSTSQEVCGMHTVRRIKGYILGNQSFMPTHH